MTRKKSMVLVLAEKCRNILSSNWRAHLNTIKADSKGSKEEIYTSKVNYIIRKGKHYLWVPEEDMHNMNTIIDERSSMAIASPFPGPLLTLLKSMKKLPARVALTGEIVALSDEKARQATEFIKENIMLEKRLISDSTHAVSGVLNSSNLLTTSRSENMKALIDGSKSYCVYKFTTSSCMLIDGHGRNHEVDLKDFETSKADPLAFSSGMIIDGINRSEVRRRALILFCLVYHSASVKDAFLLSIDRAGFDMLGRIPDGGVEHQWKEFRFTFKDEARDVEAFCSQLVDMEEEAVKKVSSYSGLT